MDKFDLIGDNTFIFKGECGDAVLSPQEVVKMLNGFNKTCERNETTIYHLESGLNCVAELIDNSDGVSGIHMNGHVVEWEDLREGGSFEEWLLDFDCALSHIRVRSRA